MLKLIIYLLLTLPSLSYAYDIDNLFMTKSQRLTLDKKYKVREETPPVHADKMYFNGGFMRNGRKSVLFINGKAGLDKAGVPVSVKGMKLLMEKEGGIKYILPGQWYISKTMEVMDVYRYRYRKKKR